MKIKDFLYKNSDLIILTGLGTYLRIKDITKFDLWYDEIFTGLLMRVPWEEFTNILRLDPHPPFYMLITKAWTSLFGVNDLTLRLLPTILGILTIILVYLVSKEIFNKKGAIFSTFLTAINPFLISYSIEARSYALFGLLLILAIYLIEKNKHNLFIFVLVLIPNAHYMGLLFIPGLMAYHWYKNWKENNLNIGKELIRTIFVGVTAIFILFQAMGREDVLNIEWARQTNLGNIPRSFTAYMYGVESKRPGVDLLNQNRLPIQTFHLGLGLFIIFVIGLIYYFLKKDSEKKTKTILLTINILIPQLLLIGYSIYEKQSLYVERYLLPASLLTLIVIGVVMANTLRLEIGVILTIVYVFTLSQLTEPDYYRGMKLLRKDLVNVDQEIILTKPVEYITAKYYIYDNRNNLKIFDPEHPEFDYAWWPFIEKEAKTEDMKKALIVIPNKGHIPEGLVQISAPGAYGDYDIYEYNMFLSVYESNTEL